MARIHDVKSIQPHFDEVVSGVKTAELRIDDRGYEVGDTLRQREFVGGRYTGNYVEHEITHKLSGGPWLTNGYCMLSLARDPIRVFVERTAVLLNLKKE
jgi:hypothetical protein